MEGNMKPYTEQKNNWKESKALGFFLNFIKNHNDPVNDNDTFELVSRLRIHEEWIDLVKKTFPSDMVKRMMGKTEYRDRLDFSYKGRKGLHRGEQTDHARNRTRRSLRKPVRFQCADPQIRIRS